MILGETRRRLSGRQADQSRIWPHRGRRSTCTERRGVLAAPVGSSGGSGRLELRQVPLDPVALQAGLQDAAAGGSGPGRTFPRCRQSGAGRGHADPGGRCLSIFFPARREVRAGPAAEVLLDRLRRAASGQDSARAGQAAQAALVGDRAGEGSGGGPGRRQPSVRGPGGEPADLGHPVSSWAAVNARVPDGASARRARGRRRGSWAGMGARRGRGQRSPWGSQDRDVGKSFRASRSDTRP